jgi:radical SAM protein with 4Fe4S-binding SPASM domain
MRGALRGADREFLSAELTTAQIKSFVDEIAWFRPYVSFTGGEPLVRKDIEELIAHIHSKNLITALNTNCTLLEEKAPSLIGAGLDYVFCSLDGVPNIDDTIRLGECSAERAVKGIKALVAQKKRLKTLLPIVQVQFTLTRENQGSILETAEFIDKELNVDVFGIVPGVFTTEELSAETSRLYEKEFGIIQRYWEGFIRDVSGMDPVTIERQISELTKRRWDFRLRLYPPIRYKDFSFKEYFLKPDKVFGDIFCSTPYVFTQLQPNGDIATCGSHPDYVAGNILKERFMDIWNGEKYRKFRAFLKRRLFPSCPRCWGFYEFYKYK